MKEIAASLADGVKERFQALFLGTYTITWVLVNHKFLLMLALGNQPISERYDYAWGIKLGWFPMFVCPAILTIIVICGIPWLDWLIQKARNAPQFLISRDEHIAQLRIEEQKNKIADLALETAKKNDRARIISNEEGLTKRLRETNKKLSEVERKLEDTEEQLNAVYGCIEKDLSNNNMPTELIRERMAKLRADVVGIVTDKEMALAHIESSKLYEKLLPLELDNLSTNLLYKSAKSSATTSAFVTKVLAGVIGQENVDRTKISELVRFFGRSSIMDDSAKPNPVIRESINEIRKIAGEKPYE